MNSLNIAFGAIFRDQMSHSDVVMSLSLSLLVMNHHQWVHVKLRELYRLKFSQGVLSTDSRCAITAVTGFIFLEASYRFHGHLRQQLLL